MRRINIRPVLLLIWLVWLNLRLLQQLSDWIRMQFIGFFILETFICHVKTVLHVQAIVHHFDPIQSFIHRPGRLLGSKECSC